MSEEAASRTVRRPRSPRHIKAAARILHKETQRILAKHAHRIVPDVVDQIRAAMHAMDRLRESGDWAGLEEQAEQLDELLHQHASFARKSALRETMENVLIAVIIALGLRSCLYEPFKIPSGSMLPTLRSGDHIFVNKFAYGVQIPFTTIVVGQTLGDIERGDVIVFRYPLDESEDFIKRVIGLPGDQVKLEGRDVFIKRMGESDFTRLPHEKLEDQRCYDETGAKEVQRCLLFRETLDGESYIVRYMMDAEGQVDPSRRDRVLSIPDGHLLVMGDNRNQSHDSLAWTTTVEAVAADGLLSFKDLRDLTKERLFSLFRPTSSEGAEDPQFDHVRYLAERRALEHDLELEVWRRPNLGVSTIYEMLLGRMSYARASDIEDVLADDHRIGEERRERLARASETIERLALGHTELGRQALFVDPVTNTVFNLRCGSELCDRDSVLARYVATIVKAYRRDHDQDARELVEPDKSVRYNEHWTGRGERKDKLLDRVFGRSGASVDAQVRVRVWRGAPEGEEWLRDVALLALGSSRELARAVATLGEDAWLVRTADRTAVIAADPLLHTVMMIECGQKHCTNESQLTLISQSIRGKLLAATREHRSIEDIVTPEIVRLPEREPESEPAPSNYEYDRVRFEASTRDPEYAVDVRAWRRPRTGIAATIDELAHPLPSVSPDDRVAAGGRSTADERSWTFLFGIPDTDTVVELTCTKTLCPNEDMALALAKRAAEKGRDASNFIDPNAERARPFVPRGNVKGRADRIWLPLSRFWLPIR